MYDFLDPGPMTLWVRDAFVSQVSFTDLAANGCFRAVSCLASKYFDAVQHWRLIISNIWPLAFSS